MHSNQGIFGVRPPKLIINPLIDGTREFTTTHATETFTPDGVEHHGLKNGDRVKFASSGTLPAGLTADTWYWVIASENTNTWKVSTTRNGGILAITDDGTGDHTYESRRTINLDYARILKNEPILAEEEIEFPLLGEKLFLERNSYWRVDIQVNIHRYTNTRAKFEELNHIWAKHRYCEIHLHRDGQAFFEDMANTPTPARFRLYDLRPFFLNDINYPDQLILRFKSEKWVYLSDGSDYTAEQLADYTPTDRTG